MIFASSSIHDSVSNYFSPEQYGATSPFLVTEIKNALFLADPWFMNPVFIFFFTFGLLLFISGSYQKNFALVTGSFFWLFVSVAFVMIDHIYMRRMAVEIANIVQDSRYTLTTDFFDRTRLADASYSDIPFSPSREVELSADQTLFIQPILLRYTAKHITRQALIQKKQMRR